MDKTLGAVEIGAFLSTLLYGVTTMQAYTYLQSPYQDRRWLRAFVVSVFLLETLHQALVFVWIYIWTVTEYGHAAALRAIPKVASLSVIFSGAAGIAIQAFFGYRLYMLSRKIWLAIMAWLLCLARACTVLGCSILLTLLGGDIVKFGQQYNWLFAASLIFSTALDLWNMIFLCHHLSKRRTVFKHTIRAVNQIILFSVETGFITSAVALATCICYYAAPYSYLWLGGLTVYSKLLTNALLVSLNGRAQAAADLASSMPSSAPAIRIAVDQNVHVELSAFENNRSRSSTVVVESSDGMADVDCKSGHVLSKGDGGDGRF